MSSLIRASSSRMRRSRVIFVLSLSWLSVLVSESSSDGESICLQNDSCAGAAKPSNVEGIAPTQASEAVLRHLSSLSESEREWVLSQVATVSKDSLVDEGGEEGRERSGAGVIILGAFITSCCVIGAKLTHVLMQEKLLYNTKHVDDQATFKSYLLYRFGYWYTWTPGSPTIVLCLLSLILLLIGGFLLRIFSGVPVTEALYACWIWIAAPDGGGSADSLTGRLVGAFVSMGGMLIFALLMSVVSSGMEEVLDAFRQGTVPVIEGGHEVILGWSPLVPTLIQELCNAAESRGGRVIAILSPISKQETEELLRDSDINKGKCIVVVRSGDAANCADLEKVSAASAHSIIVLSRPGLSRETADSRTLNVMLRLQEHGWPKHGSVVVQCELVRNKALFQSICSKQVEVITIGDAVGELMVQCSRQSGLASVLSCLLGFEGDEFYIQSFDNVVGETFGTVVMAMQGAIPVGLVTNEGTSVMLPPLDTILSDGDELIVLAEDVTAIPSQLSTDAVTRQTSQSLEVMQRKLTDFVPETIIIFGWNEMIGAVLQELDKNVGPNSKVIIYSPKPTAEREDFIIKAQRRRCYTYTRIRVSHECGPLGARFQLEELPLESANKIIILSDSSAACSEDADGDMLAVLLQIRDILKMRKAKVEPVIVPQVLNNSTAGVCQNLSVHDFVNSNDFAGRILAVVCECPRLGNVVDQILDSDCHLCVERMSKYSAQLEVISFEVVARIAANAGEIAIGWTKDDGCWEMNPKNKARERKVNPKGKVCVLSRMGGVGRVRTRDVAASMLSNLKPNISNMTRRGKRLAS